MTKYITVILPEGKMLRLLFTRMSEEDSWICQLHDDLMQDIQHTIAQGFYGTV
jgi:hypothetical protein